VNIVWHQIFWNDDLQRVYSLGALPDAALPLATVARVGDEGRLVEPDGRPLRERYLVAAQSVELDGETVDSVPIASGTIGALRLWRLRQPPRIRWIRTGVREDGDMHEPGVMQVWECQGGRLELTLLPKLSTRVELRVNDQLVRTIRFHGEEFVNTTVFAPPGARTCRFEVIPDSLLGSTVFQFVRD